jgi:hypothetical protein
VTDETDNALKEVTTALSAKVLAGAITPSFKARMEAISAKLSNPDLYEATGSGWNAIAKEIVMLTLTVKAALDRKLVEARHQEGNRQ